MIKRIRHKGLERFYRDGDVRGIKAQQAARLRILLTALDAATRPEQLNLFPGARLHPLKGERKGLWAVAVFGWCSSSQARTSPTWI
jgi:toxin HigB-1